MKTPNIVLRNDSRSASPQTLVLFQRAGTDPSSHLLAWHVVTLARGSWAEVEIPEYYQVGLEYEQDGLKVETERIVVYEMGASFLISGNGGTIGLVRADGEPPQGWLEYQAERNYYGQAGLRIYRGDHQVFPVEAFSPGASGKYRLSDEFGLARYAEGKIGPGVAFSPAFLTKTVIHPGETASLQGSDQDGFRFGPA